MDDLGENICFFSPKKRSCDFWSTGQQHADGQLCWGWNWFAGNLTLQSTTRMRAWATAANTNGTFLPKSPIVAPFKVAVGFFDNNSFAHEWAKKEQILATFFTSFLRSLNFLLLLKSGKIRFQLKKGEGLKSCFLSRLPASPLFWLVLEKVKFLKNRSQILKNVLQQMMWLVQTHLYLPQNPFFPASAWSSQHFVKSWHDHRRSS